MDDKYYGTTCPIYNDMMCLGSDECLHNNACDDIYWKVRLNEKNRLKNELRLMGMLKE